MNIAFFLIPKSEVAFIYSHSTMRQALEKMEFHRYSAVPLVDKDGKYVGTLTEGDLLWKMKHESLRFEDTHRIRIDEIQSYRINEPISINAQMDDIINRAQEQNFVPVVDDNGTFIGIIRRREIIEYCAQRLFVKQETK